MIDRVKNWDKLAPCVILYDLQKIYDIVSSMSFESGNCESGVWITIKINYKEKDYAIQGSRIDVVQKRLIDWIDNQGIRDVAMSF